MQFPSAYKRFLIDSVEECTLRILDILRDPGLRETFGRVAKDHIRRHFLLPRLLRDELRLLTDVLSGRGGRTPPDAPGGAGTA